jgi:hypothetical protein
MSKRLEKSVLDKLINGYALQKRKIGNAYKYNIKPAGIISR